MRSTWSNQTRGILANVLYQSMPLCAFRISTKGHELYIISKFIWTFSLKIRHPRGDCTTLNVRYIYSIYLNILLCLCTFARNLKCCIVITIEITMNAMRLCAVLVCNKLLKKACIPLSHVGFRMHYTYVQFSHDVTRRALTAKPRTSHDSAFCVCSGATYYCDNWRWSVLLFLLK